MRWGLRRGCSGHIEPGRWSLLAANWGSSALSESTGWYSESVVVDKAEALKPDLVHCYAASHFKICEGESCCH